MTCLVSAFFVTLLFFVPSLFKNKYTMPIIFKGIFFLYIEVKMEIGEPNILSLDTNSVLTVSIFIFIF